LVDNNALYTLFGGFIADAVANLITSSYITRQ